MSEAWTNKRNPGDRANLITFNVEKIETAYVEGKKRGIGEPVVFALDIEDPMGREIAIASGAKGDYIDRMIAECKATGRMATLITPIERFTAYKLLRDLQKELAKIDSRNKPDSRIALQIMYPAPAGKFFAIGLSFGKNLAILDIPLEKT